MSQQHMQIGIVLVVLLVGSVLVRNLRKAEHERPHYIFINETDHHEHDLALKMSLKLAESRSGIENSLILLKALPDSATIEETADRLFQQWKIGHERAGKGLLFLYSEKENLFKIEVSYALEGIFPDVFCHQLEEAAKTYMLSDIPQDFLSELLITMNIQGQDNKAELEDSFSAPQWLNSKFLSGGAGVRAKGYERTLKEYVEVVRRLPTAEFESYQPSLNPEEVIHRYLKSLGAGLGEPQLPLLTQGSQIFRVVVPRNEAQQHRVLKFYHKAMPFQIFTHENLGLVVFQSGVANLPIVLRHSSDGLWYIDEPKSWTYFHRFEAQNDFFPKYSDLSLSPDLKLARVPNALNPVYRNRVSTPKIIPYPFDLMGLVDSLEEKIRRDPHNPKRYAELGEVYLFEIDWLTKALKMFEKAAELDPNRLEYRWRLWDLYINNSEMEKAIAQLKFISQSLPKDHEAQQWLDHYSNAYNFKEGEFP